MPTIPVKNWNRKETRSAYVSYYAIPCLIGYQHKPDNRFKKVRPKTDQTLMGLLERVCECQGFTPDEVLVRSKKVPIVFTRQLFAFLASTITTFSLKDIASFIGRDHSTIIHSRDTIIGFIEMQDSDTINALKVLSPSSIYFFKKDNNNNNE